MFCKTYSFHQFSQSRQKEKLNRIINTQLVLTIFVYYIFIEKYNPYPFNLDTIYGKIFYTLKHFIFLFGIVSCIILSNKEDLDYESTCL
jgi:hypothetical protein